VRVLGLKEKGKATILTLAAAALITILVKDKKDREDNFQETK